jgi:hypothetical protein
MGICLCGTFIGAPPSKSDRYWYEYNWDTLAYDILYEHIDPIANRGIERELFTDFSLSLTGIYKESKDPIGFQNTTAEYEVTDYNNEFGGQTIQIYNQTNPRNNFYLTTNRDDKTTDKALILAFKKRLSRNRQVSGSLTWSKALQYPKGYGDKNDLIYMYGAPGAYDREWQFKITGSGTPFDSSGEKRQ